MTKKCLNCKKEFIKLPIDSKRYWGKKKFCSKKCSNDLLLGRKLSEGHKKKLSLAHKGKIPKNLSAIQQMDRTERNKKTSRTLMGHIGIKGEKNHMWKGGITPLNEKIRKSVEYKLWRTAVFERDNYQCIWGGKEHGSKLHADHIKPFCNYPELRFAIDNGRTLCVECHRKTDTYGSKALKWFETVF